MSRIFLIHGWTGGSDKDWFPWAKKQLEIKGYEVFVPDMPEPDYPKIKPWVEKLGDVVNKPRTDDIFIGHSIGCQAIERYLQTLPEEIKIDKVILIAPWIILANEALDDLENDNKIVEPWYNEPIDYEKIKKMAKWTAVFSDNDPWVSFKDNYKVYKDKLGAKIILEKGKGHFTKEDGVGEFPSILGIVR